MSADHGYLRELRLVLGVHVRRMPMLGAMMAIVALLDLISAALIAPFVAMLTGMQAPALFGLSADVQDIGALGVVLVAAFFVRRLASTYLQWRIACVSEDCRRSLILRLVRAYQWRDWQVHLRVASSQTCRRRSSGTRCRLADSSAHGCGSRPTHSS
jgi:hypothetical protein